MPESPALRGQFQRIEAGAEAPERAGVTACRSRSNRAARSISIERTAGVGNPVGTGDFAAQVEQAYLNIGTALAAIGGSFDDVAKLTIYVVDWGPDKYPLLGEGVARAAAKLGVDPVKPITLVGVAALGEPDLLVEVEATAVLP
ncbi:RidA family protein [Nocardia asteroides]|uniref:RidA family protein n=1 Tax=Nocardia asteroides TaxID=1824 RepID=UPI003440BDD4